MDTAFAIAAFRIFRWEIDAQFVLVLTLIGLATVGVTVAYLWHLVLRHREDEALIQQKEEREAALQQSLPSAPIPETTTEPVSIPDRVTEPAPSEPLPEERRPPVPEDPLPDYDEIKAALAAARRDAEVAGAPERAKETYERARQAEQAGFDAFDRDEVVRHYVRAGQAYEQAAGEARSAAPPEVPEEHPPGEDESGEVVDAVILEEHGAAQPYVGVRGENLDAHLVQQLHLPDDAGCHVHSVAPDGPAAKAGLREDDVIRRFNGEPLDDAEHLLELVAGTVPGTEVALTIWRDHGVQELTLRVDARTPKEM
jgi:PDZ domain-containing protein